MSTPHSVGMVIQSVGKGRAGAEAEITFTNGARYLTWKKWLVAKAERFAAAGTQVFPDIKRSASGNEYIEALNESSQPMCYRHYWVWVRPMIMRCHRCGELKGADR